MITHQTGAKALASSERERLAKLLAMLGSDYAGERDAAGLAAHQFLQERGLTWPEILCPPTTERRSTACVAWRATVDECLYHPYDLSPWEAGFLRDVLRCRRLSAKQAACLARIAERVLSAAGAS